MNILVISSRPSQYSGHYGDNIVKSLKVNGHNVTWGYDGIEKQYDEITRYFKLINNNNCVKNIRLLLSKIKKSIGNVLFGIRCSRYFLVKNEKYPSLVSKLQLDKIKGNYDAILVLFTSEMISANIIEKVANKYSCPIILTTIDMYWITGGCYFFGDCYGYLKSCKKCPACAYWEKDIPYHNYMKKKELFQRPNIFLYTNTYVKNIINENNFISNEKLITSSFILDENEYKPLDRNDCKRKLGVKPNQRFIMLARYSDQPRKGFKYILKSINNIFGNKNCSEVSLYLIGDDATNIVDDLSVNVINKCRVDVETLIDLYNIADVFLSASIDDAGPSMVNQAMACGTPVVSFNIGTALDVLVDGESGFVAKDISVSAYTKALHTLYLLNDDERNKLRMSTREIALKYNSLNVFSKKVESVIKSYS